MKILFHSFACPWQEISREVMDVEYEDLTEVKDRKEIIEELIPEEVN